MHERSESQAAPVLVGIDVGKRTCHIAIRQRPGEAPEQFTAPRAATAAAILAHLGTDGHPAIIVCERTGGLELPILTALEDSPHTLMIAQHTDSLALRTMLRTKRKTDKLDANLICHMAGMMLDPGSRDAIAAHLTPWETIRPTVAPRDLVRYLQSLTRDRTRAKQRREHAESAESMEARHLDAQIALLTAQIHETEATMLAMAGPEAHLLSSIPYISLRRGCILQAAIDDARRFATPDHLVSYLGLKPPHRPQSGTLTGRPIIRKGLDLLHGEIWLFGLSVAGYPHRCGTLGTTYLRIKEGTGDGRKAMWAVRRQLIRICWGILTSGEPYRGGTP